MQKVALCWWQGVRGRKCKQLTSVTVRTEAGVRGRLRVNMGESAEPRQVTLEDGHELSKLNKSGKGQGFCNRRLAGPSKAFKE